MGIVCAKVDLLDQNSICPRIKSIRGLIKNMESGITPQYNDIYQEFQKEYLSQIRGKLQINDITPIAYLSSRKQTGEQLSEGGNKRIKGKYCS